jgi:hemerythrin
MTKLVWSEGFNLGIEAIDQQHRKIVDYINQLYEAFTGGQPQKKLGKMLNELVDYTNYHFDFEENLQEKAGYPFLDAHKKTHGLFAKRISDFQTRFEKGEDIFRDADNLLSTWLFDHLKHDDADYISLAKTYLQHHRVPEPEKYRLMARLFG